MVFLEMILSFFDPFITERWEPWLLISRFGGIAALLWCTHALLFLGGSARLLGKVAMQSMVAHDDGESKRSRISEHKTAQDIISWCCCAVLLACYGCVAWELRYSLETRLWGPPPRLGTAALALHCGYTIYEASLYANLTGTDEGWLMYGHHAVVLVNYTWCLAGGHGTFWACLMGVTEGTNVCLSPLVFLRRAGRMEGALFAASAVGTWLGFLVLRLVLLAGVLYQFTSDLLSVKSSPALAARAETSGGALLAQMWSGVAAAAVLWALSAFWFYKLTRIALKLLKDKPRDKDGAEPKKETASPAPAKPRLPLSQKPKAA